MIQNFRSRALKRFWRTGDKSGLRPDWAAKAGRILDVMDRAKLPGELDIPGYGFHPLTGNLKGRYAVKISRNWRITFGWAGDEAVDVDLEDYHGS